MVVHIPSALVDRHGPAIPWGVSIAIRLLNSSYGTIFAIYASETIRVLSVLSELWVMVTMSGAIVRAIAASRIGVGVLARLNSVTSVIPQVYVRA